MYIKYKMIFAFYQWIYLVFPSTVILYHVYIKCFWMCKLAYLVFPSIYSVLVYHGYADIGEWSLSWILSFVSGIPTAGCIELLDMSLWMKVEVIVLYSEFNALQGLLATDTLVPEGCDTSLHPSNAAHFSFILLDFVAKEILWWHHLAVISRSPLTDKGSNSTYAFLKLTKVFVKDFLTTRNIN